MLSQATVEALDQAVKSDCPQTSARLFEDLVTLLSCLDDKDRYLEYLSAHLSRRLLDGDLDSIHAMEAEKQLIHVIKARLGSEFSKNLEAMVVDVEACHEKKADTQAFFNSRPQGSFKSIHVNVLANCEWFLPNPLELTPPESLLTIQKVYEDFYLQDPSNLNKRLEWNYQLGTMEIRYSCRLTASGDQPEATKEYSLVCKPYQFFVLSQFENPQTKHSGRQIQEILGLKESRPVEAILESLLAPPRVLAQVSKESQGGSPLDALYHLNPEFRPKLRKTVLKEASLQGSVGRGKSQVDSERVTAIQSCIVRVMKSNKLMEYQELVKTVEKLMLKFSPSTKAIRREIDDLIKKEYLERDGENFNRLKYLA